MEGFKYQKHRFTILKSQTRPAEKREEEEEKEEKEEQAIAKSYTFHANAKMKRGFLVVKKSLS